MKENITYKKASSIVGMVVMVMSVAFASTAGAIEPEKQPIYVNIEEAIGLCGTINGSPCTVPAGQRLVITFVSGYTFEPLSSKQNRAVSMVITDQQLGLNGNSFHIFPAIKVNSSGGTDVYAFMTPLNMMLNPGTTFFFESVAVAVSGYLVDFP
jgi:hypothetical protein